MFFLFKKRVDHGEREGVRKITYKNVSREGSEERRMTIL
jgi:hypothetical protein